MFFNNLDFFSSFYEKGKTISDLVAGTVHGFDEIFHPKLDSSLNNKHIGVKDLLFIH